ncbi:MAG: DNA-binding protein [Candidatus Heimdallarchaeota archaeon]|nr:DNA-binding protein [Candidatus Heimdallarchaeota archaeon]
MSDDLEEIRRRRLKELQDASSTQPRDEEIAKQEEANKQVEIQKQSILRKILTDSARQRLNNIKLVKPQMAEAIEDQLIQLAQVGRIPNGILNEEQLLDMLKKLQHGKRESSIKFKRV